VEAAAHALRQFFVLESVCCLECGEIYSKPAAGGTVEQNPGCPECGYVGWIPLSLPPEPEPEAPSRPAADPPQRPSVRSH
jgi:predicted  nucleic acid-binding Zn-ribbon protein